MDPILKGREASRCRAIRDMNGGLVRVLPAGDHLPPADEHVPDGIRVAAEYDRIEQLVRTARAEERRVGVDNERTVESPRVAVDDTVESTQIEVEEADLEDDLDLINSTALIKMSEDTAAMLQQADETETGVIDLSDATGEMPTIETPELTSRDLRVVFSK